MNKKEIYTLLSARNIWHDVTEHKAVYNRAEVAEIQLPYPEADAKNLFIRTTKSAITISLRQGKQASRPESLPAAERHSPLTFASDQDLMDMLGLIPGAVTPLGLLNDREHKVTFWLDKSFLEGSGLYRCPSQRQHRHRMAQNRGSASAPAGERYANHII